MAKGAETCCGCLSLVVGVELICLGHLLSCIAIIAVASSVEPLEVSGIEFSPTAQVANAAWALAGIPVIIGAGVGVLYRIESHLRTYFGYLLVTFILNSFWWSSFLVSGSICQTIVAKDVQRMGTAFVCGFTDTFVFFWMLLAMVISLYCCYMVYSAAEDCKERSYPEMLKYSGALQGSHMPLPNQSLKGPQQSMGMGPRGMHPPEMQSWGHPEMQSAPQMGGPPVHGGSMMQQHPMSAPPMYGGAGGGGNVGGYGSVGQPQSFVPQPMH